MLQIVLRGLSIVMCVTVPKYSNESSCACSSRKTLRDSEKNVPDSNNPLLNSDNVKGEKKAINHAAEWQAVVKVLDRVMFLIFLIAVFLLAVFFFPRPQ